MRSWRLVVVVVVLVPLIGGGPASAQSDGRVSGVVRDATGAVIPGVTVTATNQATKDSRTATTAGDGSYSLSLAPGSYQVTASIPGFRRVTQAVDVAADASKQLDFSLDTALTEEITVTATKREQMLLDVPFSVAAPTEEVLRDRGVEDIEGVAANVGGFTVQNLGPGPEPGCDSRRVCRPDRARSAGSEGAGRRLPRRIGHLSFALHAGSRPV